MTIQQWIIQEIAQALSLQLLYEWLGFLGALYVIRAICSQHPAELIEQIRSRHKVSDDLEDVAARGYGLRARSLRRLQAAEAEYQRWEAQYLARNRTAERKALKAPSATLSDALIKDHEKEFAICVLEDMRQQLRTTPRSPTSTDIQKTLDCI